MRIPFFWSGSASDLTSWTTPACMHECPMGASDMDVDHGRMQAVECSQDGAQNSLNAFRSLALLAA